MVALILVRMIILGGVVFFSASARFVAAAMTGSLGVMVRFVVFFLENTVPDTLDLCVLFTHRFQHW